MKRNRKPRERSVVPPAKIVELATQIADTEQSLVANRLVESTTAERLAKIRSEQESLLSVHSALCRAMDKYTVGPLLR